MTIASRFLDKKPGVYYVYRRGCSSIHGEHNGALAGSFDEALAKTDSYVWVVTVTKENIQVEVYDSKRQKIHDETQTFEEIREEMEWETRFRQQHRLKAFE